MHVLHMLRNAEKSAIRQLNRFPNNASDGGSGPS